MRYLLILGVVAALAAPALADDLYPPPWRGDPGSTFQHWSFTNPPDVGYHYYPELVDNPNGTPDIYDPGEGYAGYGWFDQFAGRQGVLAPYWQLSMWIPNYSLPNPYKDVQIQVTWWCGAGPLGDAGQTPWPYLNGYDTGTAGTLVSDEVLSDGWNHTVFSFHIEPNPIEELIEFWPEPDHYGYFAIDQIVVDTICIPEPASLLLALAGLLLRRR